MSSHMLPVGNAAAVHIIHDNPEWIAPFTDALDRLGVAHVEWLLPETTIDLAAEPLPGCSGRGCRRRRTPGPIRM